MCFIQNYLMFSLMMNLQGSKHVVVFIFFKYDYEGVNDKLCAFCG